MRRTAALILGGGPAGAAAAIRLAEAGQRPLLLERERETGDALCGGFLSWRTLESLARLGVDTDTLGPSRVTRLRLFTAKGRAEAALPGIARGVSRRRLDSTLLAHAERLGAGIERGVSIRALEAEGARLGDGTIVRGDAILLATGKHELRGAVRTSELPADPVLGLRTRLDGHVSLDGVIELHLFDGGYAGLVLQEDGTANLCMAVHRSRLEAAGSPEALLAALGEANPALGERLARRSSGARIDAVANIPYGWRAHATAPGRFRLGDQAAVIPSLAGEGIGIALASGESAAAALIRGGPGAAEVWQPRFARQAARPMRVAGLVRMAAEHRYGADFLVAAARLAPGLVSPIAALSRIATMPN